MSKLFWLIVFVVVLLIVVDRVGDFVAERIVADRLQTSQELADQPDVDIFGFPFLSQFASGSYDHVRATATDVPVGSSGNALRLTRVQVDFHDVTTTRSFDSFHADSATAKATVSYAELSRRLGADVSYDGNGRIKAGKKFTVLGKTVEPTISVKPSVVNGVLSFTGATINGLQNAPAPVTAALDRIFDPKVSLKDVPFDVEVTSLKLDSKGLQLDLSGKDLSYTAKS